MIKVIIVDDEPKASKLIEILIKKFFPQLQIKGIAEDGNDAYNMIIEHTPDLVFLDIEIGKMTAFDLLEKFDKIAFSIIFISAYEDYALKAIKMNALDYLIKPADVNEFINSVRKALERIDTEDRTKNASNLLTQIKGGVFAKVAINTSTETRFVDINEIVRCEAYGNTTMCFLSSGQKIHSTKTLKTFEEKLSKYQFLRIHSKHLVNQFYISNFKKDGNDSKLFLKDGSSIAISLRRKGNFWDNIESI